MPATIKFVKKTKIDSIGQVVVPLAVASKHYSETAGKKCYIVYNVGNNEVGIYGINAARRQMQGSSFEPNIADILSELEKNGYSISTDGRYDVEHKYFIRGKDIVDQLKAPKEGWFTKKAKVSFDSVILPEDKKLQIESALSQVQNFEKIFVKWGFENVMEKGTAISFLFYGSPGTGKTLMAQAIADKLEQPLLSVGSAEIESSVPGEAERNIKRYFAMARAERGRPTGKLDENGDPILSKPERCVILFDECDSLITDRSGVGMILASQINTLLSELENHNGIVVFTTNRVGSMDAAMERRITAKIEFPFPDSIARCQIWRRMIPKKCPLIDVDLEDLAEYPIAGGNIKNAVLNAARSAAHAKKKGIHLEDFVTAIEKEIQGIKDFEHGRKGGRGVASNSEAMVKELEGLDITPTEEGRLEIERTRSVDKKVV